MTLLKSLNLLLASGLELAMLAAFGYWGWNASQRTLVQVILSMGTPALVAVGRGIWLDANSARRLGEPWAYIAEVALFALAVVALYSVGQPGLAVLLVVLVILNKVLLVVWKQ
jgi:hypothetical protein